ncbi:MAG: VCBS repeat-containing protein [Acidobacteria bacterium]|nr:MAG: VCBS repeat-containing protein [Acidobacteriota bacterium]
MSCRAIATSDRTPPRWPALLAALAAIVLAGGSAGDPGATTPPAEAGTAAEESAAPPADDLRARAEREGWHYEEETGRYYRIEKVQRVERAYHWIDEAKTKVQFPRGVIFDVVEYDDDFFTVKVYGTPFQARRAPPPPATDRRAERAAAAETYEVAAGEVDRLLFVPFDRGLPQVGQWRETFDVADMNEDGHLDVVFGPSRKGSPRPNVLLGDGEGNWRWWSEARWPALPYDYGAAAAGDLNGDGHLDMVLGVHLRGILAIVGDGRGHFEPWTEGIDFKVPGRGDDVSGFSSRRLELLDWDGDGKLDILALGEGPKAELTGPSSSRMLNESLSFVLYRNKGDGTWEAHQVGGGDREFGTDFTFGDWNGDGLRDTAIASARAGSAQIIGFGTGGDELRTAELPALRPRAFLRAAAAADLDRDGRDELLLGYLSNELGVWRGGIDVYRYLPGEEPTWERRPLYVEEARKGVTALATGDLDGDGNADVVALNAHGEVWALLGDGTGGVARELSPELPSPEEGCEGYDVHLVDLDGDARPEVIAAFAGEPQGFSGVPGLFTQGCKGQGRIRAWKAVPRPAESTDQPGAGEPGSDETL